MLDHENIFKYYLKKKKLKFTPERKLTLDTVFSLHKHFNIERLYKKLHKKNKHISMSTLYRTIPLFLECGLVREALHRDGETTYEHIFGHTHHDHLLCVNCGRIIEFSDNK